MSGTVVRPAAPHEAGDLSRLAMRSKAHWGYDQAFLDACRADLTITPDRCDGADVQVAVADNQIAGFFEIRGTPPTGELANLWVDPRFMGAGIGRSLWNTALVTARGHGYTTLTIDSDPHAEPFYIHMGAVRIGEARSTVDPGRILPLLRIAL